MSADKEQIGEMLERIWKNYSVRFDGLQHDLIVLAIPRYPSNIEAIAAVDVTTIRMVMRQFVNAREVADERPSISPTEVPGAAEAAAAGSGLQHQLGARSDAGGPPEEPSQQTPEADQGDAAVPTVEPEVERLRAILRRCMLGAEPVDIGGGEIIGLYQRET